MADRYAELIRLLRSYDRVYTEHVGDDASVRRELLRHHDRFIHDRDLQWLRESDLVVAEVTIPSLGVGYEIARAIELDKPVLCLFSKNSKHRLSAMIAGNPGLTLVLYESMADAAEKIERYMAERPRSGA